MSEGISIPPPPPPPPIKPKIDDINQIIPPPPPPPPPISSIKKEILIKNNNFNPRFPLINNSTKEINKPIQSSTNSIINFSSLTNLLNNSQQQQQQQTNFTTDLNKTNELFGDILKNPTQENSNSLTNILFSNSNNENSLKKPLTPIISSNDLLEKLNLLSLTKLTKKNNEELKEELISKNSDPIPNFTPSTIITFSRSQFLNLQSCINSVSEKTHIKIPSGIYPEKLNITKEIYLQGFGQVSIHGLNISSSSLINKIIIQSNNQGNDGDTVITKGNVDFYNCTFFTNLSSSIYLHNYSIVKLNNCNICSLEKPSIIVGNYSSLSINDSIIDGSKNNGIITMNNSSIHINNCNIKNNGKSGIISNDSSSIVIKNSDIQLNGENGIIINSNGSCLINNSKIHHHRNGTGISIQSKISVNIEKCEFSFCNNSAIQVLNGAKLFSIENTFSDCYNSSMILINFNSIVSSSGDNFNGKCTSAISCLNQSEIYIENSEMKNITNSGILGFVNSIIRINNLKIIDSPNTALNFENEVFVDINNLEIINSLKNPILFNNINGKIYNSKFLLCKKSCEINDCNNLIFQNCLFKEFDTSSIQITKNNSCEFIECTFSLNKHSGIEIEGETSKPKFYKCNFENNSNHGIGIYKNSNPILEECNIYLHDNFGIIFNNSNGNISKCNIYNNKSGAIDMRNNSNVNINETLFNSNGNTVIQIHQQGTSCKLNNCKIENQIDGGGIVILNGGSLEILNSLMNNFKGAFIEIRNNSKCLINNSNFSNALKSPIIQIQGNSDLILENSKLENCSKIALFIGPTSNVIINNSIIKDTIECGVSISNNSKVQINNSIFENNGQFGIFSYSKDLIIENNKIINCTKCGIIVPKDTEINEINNLFENIGQNNLIFN